MQITNDQAQNFTGAFRIKPSELKAKTEIPELFTQGRQIFHDILEKGDEVIVLRDHYDKRVTKYIKQNNIKDIEYFPSISTKSGLDDQQPEGLLALLKDKTTQIITDIKEMSRISRTRKNPKNVKSLPQASSEITKPSSIEEAEKVANTLRLYIERPKITSTKASTIIRDEEKKRTIEIITANKGTTYVHMRPDSICQSSIRCIINGKGQIVKMFETPDEMRKFLKQFRELKNANINILTDN